MSPPVDHAIELALDDEATRTIELALDALHAVGVRTIRDSSPLAHPHVSLGVAAGAESERLAGVLAGVGTEPLPELVLSSLGAFTSGPTVVFLGVAPSPALLARNALVHERLDNARIEVRPIYRPGSWVPHCTLAMHVDDVASAMGALEGVSLPIQARPVAVRVVEVPTGKVRATVC